MIRLFNHYLSVRLLLLTALEAFVVFQSVVLGFDLREANPRGDSPLLEATTFTAVMLLSMSALGLYQIHAEPFRTTVHRLLIAYGLALLCVSLVFYLFPETYIGRGVLAWSTLLALASVLLLRTVFFRLTDVGLPKRRVLVLGNGAEAEEVIRYLHEGASRKSVQYAGLYPVMPDASESREALKLSHDGLRHTVEELRVSEIVVAVRERRGGVLPLRRLLDCRLRGIKVMDLQSFYEREQGVLHIDNMRASWMIFGNGFGQSFTRDVVKRLFDVGVSLALIVLTLPLLLVAMIAIVIESGMPILYTQERVGEGGRRFRIVKLRTMVQNAEADGKPRWAGLRDARITRVGACLRRTRIDELPQLWNVLRGDMSFVGPRPERPYFVEQLTEKIPFYDVRHSVKPGVTGWAQVRHTYTSTVEEGMVKLQYDLYYVKNHSLFLDLMILVETVQVVLLGKGAR
ncbi:MAG: TIGR03013 family PEP-CTERM/XrtA system glycosyltransferase [Burkholderiaceae bacterium]|jgi:sugar transferase (PEP-CTERM system associated)|nr:TIGR03013 family PEP-CTERM/XrtA system glycosyltransferase [Burkholderiales bacterium]MCZ8337318.1 TIGR03013 family PEP-CTERM/XrtA system glycosyltransferase [Burkholderiaceae bacterium]